MSGGYTHTTITAETGEPVRIDVSFRLDGYAWVRAIGTDTARPHLTIEHGEVRATIGPASPGQVTAQDARIARQLADHAAAYAAAIERLASAAGDGPAAA